MFFPSLTRVPTVGNQKRINLFTCCHNLCPPSVIKNRDFIRRHLESEACAHSVTAHSQSLQTPDSLLYAGKWLEAVILSFCPCCVTVAEYSTSWIFLPSHLKNGVVMTEDPACCIRFWFENSIYTAAERGCNAEWNFNGKFLFGSSESNMLLQKPEHRVCRSSLELVRLSHNHVFWVFTWSTVLSEASKSEKVALCIERRIFPME